MITWITWGLVALLSIASLGAAGQVAVDSSDHLAILRFFSAQALMIALLRTHWKGL